MGIYLVNNSVKRVGPNPFGRIGLGAMSKKEHNSIGDWALQQKRRRQLNELLKEFKKRAPMGMPNPATGKYNDKPKIIKSGFLNLMIGQKLKTKLGGSNEQFTKRLLKLRQT